MTGPDPRGPELVDAIVETVIRRDAFALLVQVLAAERVLSRGDRDTDTDRVRRETLREVFASGDAVSAPLVQAALGELDDAERDDLLAQAGAAAELRVRAAAARVVAGAQVLGRPVQATPAALEWLACWATAMLPAEVMATIAPPAGRQP